MCGHNTKQILLQIRKNNWPKSRLFHHSSSIINNYIYHRVSETFIDSRALPLKRVSKDEISFEYFMDFFADISNLSIK